MPIFRRREKDGDEELDGLSAFANLHGLRFSAQDMFGLAALPFPLFSMGDDHGCKNVVYGTWKDINAWAFTLWVMDEDPDDHSHGYAYYRCGAAPLPANCPQIHIRSTSFLTRGLQKLGFQGQAVRFESDEFNRAFRVTATEPKFAYDVVNEQMMQWLLATPKGWHFSISGTYILAYTEHRQGDYQQVAETLDMVVGFYRQIPDVVAELYRLNAQPQLTPEQANERAKAMALGFTPADPSYGANVVGAPAVAGEVGVEAQEAVNAAMQQLQQMGIAIPPGAKVNVSSKTIVRTVGPDGTVTVSPGGEQTSAEIAQALAAAGLGAAAGATVGVPAVGAAGAVRGTATIRSVQETGMRVPGGRMCTVEFDVSYPGQPARQTALTALVTDAHADRVKPGASLAIDGDPANPDIFRIDWNATL